MILYADASALAKRYVAENRSAEVIALTSDAEAVATAIINRAEVAAALSRSVRLGVVDESGGRRAQRRFASEWPDLVRLPITEPLVIRAESVAWEYGLRGYDALQLASALTWKDSIGAEVTLATFDRELWAAAPQAGLRVWPEKLPRARH
jgi:predicted nucleic acid-binding protein